MKVLITGGLGYLGGRLAQHLSLNEEFELLLVSRRKLESPNWLPSVQMVETEWASQKQLVKICEGVDAVVHLASMNAVESARSPARALQMNGVSTVRLLEAAIKQHVSRFIYLSTAHVYGTPLQGLIDETIKTLPLYPYATSHKAGEDVVMAAHHLGRIEGIVLRLSNSFGPPTHETVNCWNLLIPDLCRQAVTENKMVLHSSGLQRRDFIPMIDACNAIKHVLQLPGLKLGEGLFNVGGNWCPTVYEVACLIRRRCVNLLNRSPLISRKKSQSIERTLPLTYNIERLRKTGFELNGLIEEEIDGLLIFCQRILF